MGGINPNRNDGYQVNRAVYEHCHELFQGLSDFFAAHAALEILVMAEADKDSLDTETLHHAIAGFASADQHFSKVAVPQSADLLEVADRDGTWQGDYFRAQAELLSPLRESSSALAAAANSGSLTLADEGFQDSMWHNGSNAAIRTNSVVALRALIAAVTHHLDVVEETNAD